MLQVLVFYLSIVVHGQLREKENNFLFSLEEKGQYVTITFTTTCNYLVFATKFLLFTTIVTSC
jgi:hypothetical protein